MPSTELAKASPREAGLTQSLEKMLDRNRTKWSEMARFTESESLRLVELQLDHVGHAFAQFNDRPDFSGLLDAQHQWFKEVMQDYVTQSLRYAMAFRAFVDPTCNRLETGKKGVGDEGHEEAEEIQIAGDSDAADLSDESPDMAEATHETNESRTTDFADVSQEAMEEIREAMERTEGADEDGATDLTDDDEEAVEEIQEEGESRTAKPRKRRNKRSH